MDKAEAASAVCAAAARTAALCVGVPDEVWHARLAPGGYSMADIVEHMAEANGQILGALHLALKAGEKPQPFASVADEEVAYAFIRAGELPGARPSALPLSVEAALARVKESAEAIAAWSAGVDVDLRTVGLTHPKYGSLDGVQWMLLALAHIETHRGDLMMLKRGVSPSAGLAESVLSPSGAS